MASERQPVAGHRHSLCSSTLVVLAEEHEVEYAQVLSGFRDSFQPCDPIEDALVLRLAHAHWRGLRSRRVENGIRNRSAAAQSAEAQKTSATAATEQVIAALCPRAPAECRRGPGALHR